MESTRVIVGQRSIVGTECRAYKMTTIGADCNIGNKAKFQDATIGDKVTLGDGANIYEMTIQNNVIAGKGLNTASHGIIKSGARLGDYVMMGIDARINENIVVGNRVCIGNGSTVDKPLPDNCIYNRDGIIRPRTPGKMVTRENGDCEEIDRQ